MEEIFRGSDGRRLIGVIRAKLSDAVSHRNLLRQDQAGNTRGPRGIDSYAVIADFREALHM
jgi:hypothetical protein